MQTQRRGTLARYIRDRREGQVMRQEGGYVQLHTTAKYRRDWLHGDTLRAVSSRSRDEVRTHELKSPM